MLLDPGFEKLAAGLAGFSTELARGERVLIDAFDVPEDLVVLSGARTVALVSRFDTRARLDGNTTGTVRASCATAFAMSPKMKRCTGYIVYQ